jgi:hypothetical protein
MLPCCATRRGIRGGSGGSRLSSMTRRVRTGRRRRRCAWAVSSMNTRGSVGAWTSRSSIVARAGLTGRGCRRQSYGRKSDRAGGFRGSGDRRGGWLRSVPRMGDDGQCGRRFPPRGDLELTPRSGVVPRRRRRSRRCRVGSQTRLRRRAGSRRRWRVRRARRVGVVAAEGGPASGELAAAAPALDAIQHPHRSPRPPRPNLSRDSGRVQVAVAGVPWEDE